jgi:hypothetical protein
VVRSNLDSIRPIPSRIGNEHADNAFYVQTSGVGGLLYIWTLIPSELIRYSVVQDKVLQRTPTVKCDQLLAVGKWAYLLQDETLYVY